MFPRGNYGNSRGTGLVETVAGLIPASREKMASAPFFLFDLPAGVLHNGSHNNSGCVAGNETVKRAARGVVVDGKDDGRRSGCPYAEA